MGVKRPARVIVTTVIIILAVVCVFLLFLSSFKSDAFGDAQELYYGALAYTMDGEGFDHNVAFSGDGAGTYQIQDMTPLVPYLKASLKGTAAKGNSVYIDPETRIIEYAKCTREITFFGKFGFRASGTYPKQKGADLVWFQVQAQ